MLQIYIPRIGIFLMIEMKDLIWVSGVFSLIKTITKFSFLIGYQQPDLSINWTVAHIMLAIGQCMSFCAR